MSLVNAPESSLWKDAETMNLGNLVVLRTYHGEMEASIAASYLEAEGIEIYIHKDDVGGAYPALQMSGGVKLLVNPDDLETAEKILSEAEELGSSRFEFLEGEELAKNGRISPLYWWDVPKPAEDLRERPVEEKESVEALSSKDGCVDSVILRILRNTDQSELSYIWRAWLIGTIGTYVSFVLVSYIAESHHSLPIRSHSTYEEALMYRFFWSVVWAPLKETLIMWPILLMLNWLLQKPLLAALVSAALWAMYHSVHHPWHGFVVFWGFFVMSVCFLEWHKKSTSKAILVTTSIHMLNNAVPFVARLVRIIVTS